MTTYCVKVRQSGKKSWAFLTSKGGTNRLRIHASEIPDKARAESIAAEINQENQGVYEARAEVFSADERGSTLTPVVAILTVFTVSAVLIAQNGLVNALLARFAQVIR